MEVAAKLRQMIMHVRVRDLGVFKTLDSYLKVQCRNLDTVPSIKCSNKLPDRHHSHGLVESKSSLLFHKESCSDASSSICDSLVCVEDARLGILDLGLQAGINDMAVH